MWLKSDALFDKDDKDSDYAQTLRELGLKSNDSFDDVAIVSTIRVRIDTITEVVKTKSDGITQITTESGNTFILKMAFDEVNTIIDEYYLG
jgi:hypothetical protein